MIRIKLCGLTRKENVLAANRLRPDNIGFVFWERSRRYLTIERAEALREILSPDISAVGVFIDEDIDKVQSLLKNKIIDMAQLHGNEDEDYIRGLRETTGRPVIKAFRIRDVYDVKRAMDSPADLILLDSGAGGGRVLDWSLLRDTDRPYYLAGGLTPDNVAQAVRMLSPYAVDVSSGIETDGIKDEEKMIRFVNAVRGAEND